VASSKKTDPSKRGSSESKTQVTRIDDAVIVKEETPDAQVSTEAPDDVARDAPDAVQTAEASDASGPQPETSAPVNAGEAPDPEQRIDEPVAEKDVPAAQPSPVAQKGNTFLPMVLGGIIAGVIGFSAAQLELFDQGDAGITNQLRADLNAQQDRIATLETAEPEERPQVDLAPLEARMDAIDARLTALEDRPSVTLPASMEPGDAAAYAAELETLKSSVDDQRGEIENLIANARTVEQATADAARTASAQTAIARIVSAIDAGRPFAESLADLKALDAGAIDPALDAVAAEGVTTLSVLQAEFPERARDALAAARSAATGDGQQGLGGFLTRSLGARSVTPREGSDPDAVLSRAEAAINSGDLNATLAELDTLPEEAQDAIGDWRAAADTRVAARTAADDLAQRLTAD
jgi:hypothetical protein